MSVYKVKVTRTLVLEKVILVRANTARRAMDDALAHAAEMMGDDDFDVARHDEDATAESKVPLGETLGGEIVDRSPY